MTSVAVVIGLLLVLTIRPGERGPREELRASIVAHEQALDEGVRALDALKAGMRALDEEVSSLRGEFAAKDGQIRTARQVLESVRAEVMQFELARVTAT